MIFLQSAKKSHPSTMSLEGVAEHCYNITQSYLDLANQTSIVDETKEAIKLTRDYLLKDIFKRWDPFSGQISFSYNGGKDCQVLLIVYLSCLWEFFKESIRISQFSLKFQKFPLEYLPTVYIDQAETFQTLEDFIELTKNRYFLSLYESPRNQTSMPQAFRNYLDLNENTEAIVIGIRHTDPYGEKLKCIERTDSNWPDFIRLQPLLHWKLANVWSLLLYSGEELCGLYEYGFTSIGGVNTTRPNPFLKKGPGEDNGEAITNHFSWEISNAYGKAQEDSSVPVTRVSDADLDIIQKTDDSAYYPGWFLIEDSKERAGRS